MKRLTLVHLYPRQMSTYGDRGNVICWTERLKRRGYEVSIHYHQPGDTLPKAAHGIFMGGGQDSGQAVIETDFQRVAPWIKSLTADGIPMLAICGAYQLLGQSFEMLNGKKLDGLGVLDVETIGRVDRLIGNIHVQTEAFGELVGFENHSGRTFLGSSALPLGRVSLGAGNNGEDETEGSRWRNVIGTYLHGPILPKNPALADWLIATMLGQSNTKLEPLDDSLSETARLSAKARPR